MRWLCLAPLLVLCGCSASEDLSAATNAINRFHSELNAGQFETIYDTSAPGWKQATPQSDTIKLFSAIHGKLGLYLSGTQTGWHVNYGTGGTTIVLQYASNFQKGEAQETFTYIETGKSAQLVGYNINSRALITG